MKSYHVSTTARIRTALLLLGLLAIGVYAGRKAWGLWSGLSAKPADAFLFNLDLNTTVPAALLTLTALACGPVAWYLLIELLTKVAVSDSGLLVSAPGYRLFYRWNEVATLDVLTGPAEDAAVCLRVETVSEATTLPSPAQVVPAPKDEIALFLSEADLREDKAARSQARAARSQELARLQSRATRPDGRALPAWMRLLYPQARRPDRLLLYPSLQSRTLLLAEIEQRLEG